MCKEDARQESKDTSNGTTFLQKLGVPMVLITSLWGAFGVILKAYSVINEKRDLIFEYLKNPDNNLTLITPTELYFTNLLPLSFGLILFLSCIAIVIYKIPAFVPEFEEKFQINIRRVRSLVLIPIVYAIVAFTGGGIFDFIKFVNNV